MHTPLALALLAAAALSACDKKDQPMGLTHWQDAPPLLAGVDEGAVAPPPTGVVQTATKAAPAADIATTSQAREGRQGRRRMGAEGVTAEGESRGNMQPRRDREPKTTQ